MKERYSVPNAAAGDYTMTVTDIQPNDAGRYFCLRGNFTLKPHYVTETEHLHAVTVELYVIYVEGNICKNSVFCITVIDQPIFPELL